MANNFNFQASLKLNSTGFRKGVSQVKSSLTGLKTSFLQVAGALGAGLGFTQLIANLKTTATELSVAKNTLQNVSYETKKYTDGIKELTVEVSNYQENLAFVKRLSEEYGQDLVALTNNFAQFTSACKKTDLALDDQRKVFEALSRAAAYYHMSADRTKDMLNAVTQMMSKGKIAAEELRRQLGNALPGAFNLMAASMGVSNAELDKLMREGKVIAADVLPQFAAMLNTITKEAHFDSLQKSLNDFKNTWYKLVENSGAEDFFKSIVDGSINVVSWIGTNINDLLGTIKAFVITIASYKIFKGWEAQGKAYLTAQTKQLDFLTKELNKYNAKVKGLTNPTINYSDKGAFGHIGTMDETTIQLVKKYNTALIEAETTKRRLYGVKMMGDDDLAKIKAYNKELDIAIAKCKLASKETKTIGVAWAGVKNVVSTVAATIKSMGIMALISAIIGGVTKIWTTVKDTLKEWERIKNIYSNYTKDLEKGQHSVKVSNQELNNYLEIAKDVSKTERVRQAALDKVNELMGRINDNQFKLSDLEEIEGGYDKITAAVARWCEMTLLQKKIADAQSAQADAEGQLEIKRGELKISQAEDLATAKRRATWKGSMPTPDGMSYIEVPEHELELTSTKTAQLTEEIKQLEAVIADSKVQTQGFQNELVDLLAETNNGDDNKLEGLAKIIENYKTEAEGLGRQLTEDAIMLKDYNTEMNNLLINTFKAAAATGEVSMKTITQKMDSNKALSDFEKWYLDIRDKMLQFSQQVLLDSIADSIIQDIDEAIAKEAEELEKELEKILEDEEKRRQVDIDYAGATSELKYENSRNKRDGTFDYKKSRADIFGEEADIANENLDRVMDKIKELNDKQKELLETTGQGLDDIAKKELSSLQEYYRQLAKEARTIEEAYRFEQIRQDIEDFEKEMISGVFSGIENFATSLDRVVTGAQQLRDIMENTDSTGWEKIMGVVNYIFNILNAVTSVIETVNTLTEISNMLAGARSLLDEKKKADAAIELEGTVAQVAAEETLAAVKAKEAAFETTITANKIAQAEASLGVATALGVETAAWIALAAAMKDAAIAAAAANAAAVAGPGAPAAALAAAASVGAGLTATMAAFAKGGIVGGNSTRGDRNLARVNSGEMILNKAQQGTLFNMLNGKGGLGGNVQFKIHGADLVGTINNYNSRKRG